MESQHTKPDLKREVPHLHLGGADGARRQPNGRRTLLGLSALVVCAAVAAGIGLGGGPALRHAAARADRGGGFAVKGTPQPRLAGRLARRAEARARRGAGAARPRAGAAPGAPTRAPVRTQAPAPAQPRDLSESELLAYADGTSVYEPASYLVHAYREAAARYGIPWRLLAAVAYLRGSDVDALAGAGARPLREVASETQAAGVGALDQHRLAWALEQADAPSRMLIRTAATLAADGAASSPAKGLAAYLSGTGVPVSTALTLAAATSPPVRITTALSAIEASPLAHEAPAPGPDAVAARTAHALTRTTATETATTTKPAATATTPAATTTTPAAGAQSGAPAAAPPPAPVRARIDAMLNEARLLNGLPYIWGGGHTNPAWVASAGYDCSGFVSEVLHAAGYLNSPETTQTLPGAAGIANGPGRYVTIYDRTIATLRVWVKRRRLVTVRRAVNPATIGVHVTKGRHLNAQGAVSIRLPRWVGEWRTIKLTKLVPSLDTSNNDEHVIIDIDGHWWESGGSSSDGGAAMVHPIIDPSAAYLRSFNRILHPVGL